MYTTHAGPEKWLFFLWWLLTLPPVHSKICFDEKNIHRNNEIKRTTIFTATIAYSVLNTDIRYEDIFLLASYLDMSC